MSQGELLPEGIDVSQLRTRYSATTFTENNLISQTNPIIQFHSWLQEALKCDRIAEAQSMCLSTCTKDGKPSSRTVLLKGYSDKGFVFYTNQESRKGRELSENKNACLLFYWEPLHRQVRIEGTVERVATEISEEYFRSRPKSSQASAAVSLQSREISSREELEAKHEELLTKYPGDQPIPRPHCWGGYILEPTVFEFWQGQSNRLHDRLVFVKDGTKKQWSLKRLYP